jgi:phage recombination protein Bet
MTTEIVKKDQQAEVGLMKISENDVRRFFDKEGKCTNNEIALFLRIAQMNNLNPFNRELHLIKYGTVPASIITGYEVYLKRAQASGKWAGMKVWTEGEGKDMVAKVKIYRHDWKEPLEHEVYYNEAVKTKGDGTPTATWKSMPRFMLKKVAVAQGLRWAFPEEVGGLPYTADEMGVEGNVKQEKEYTPEFDMPKEKESAKEQTKDVVQAEIIEDEKKDDNADKKESATTNGLISEKQRIMLFAKITDNNLSKMAFQNMIKTSLKIESTKELNQDQYQYCLNWIEESVKAGLNKKRSFEK